ncbi:MAG: serine hydrolase domain-containing protein [Hyphomonadaceae bacterium]
MSALADARINGEVAPGFERVREAFAENFERDESRRDVGAALSVYHRGERVVNLWGGWRDAACTTPWTRDTLANVYSTTKGIVAVAFAMAYDRGLIDYQAPVSRYWPEFAANGKERTTVSQVLSHQAGLPGFMAPTGPEDIYDWRACCAKLGAQAPAHAIGENTCYHAGTFGFLAGEIFRRAVGQTLGAFIATQIARPLEADIHLGGAAKYADRIAPMIAPSIEVDLAALGLSDIALMAMTNPNLDPAQANTAAWRDAELPAMNLHATAEGVARVFAALANAGVLHGLRLLGAGAIAAMTEVQSERQDLLLGFAIPWARGVALNATGVFGANPRAFGHTGWGGSFGYADLEAGVGAAYVINRMGPELVGDTRAVALATAISASVSRL